MINKWLYDNLWLWITIKVARVEHKVENISRNENTIQDKKEFKHYLNVSSFIFG